MKEKVLNANLGREYRVLLAQLIHRAIIGDGMKANDGAKIPRDLGRKSTGVLEVNHWTATH